MGVEAVADMKRLSAVAGRMMGYWVPRLIEASPSCIAVAQKDMERRYESRKVLASVIRRDV